MGGPTTTAADNPVSKDARCAVERECGGCSLIGVPYEAQLARKDAHMRELFEEPFPDAEIRPIIGMEDPYHYRGKVTSPFAPGRRTRQGGAGGKRAAGKGKAGRNASGKAGADKVALHAGGAAGAGGTGNSILTGMYAAGTHRLVATDGCLVEDARAQQVIRAVRSIMVRHGIEPYDEDRGTGFMRHAVVRVGHESGEVLVTLVTNSDEFPASRSFCRELVKRCPFVTSVVQNVNLRKTNVILGEQERRLYGPGFILDTLCGLSFRISSRSFYQVNARQTSVLYECAMQLAGLAGPGGAGEARGGDECDSARPAVAIDAYCGTGTIGLVAATRGAASVVGVDTVEDAIRDARENARHNGVGNARFVAADAGAFMRDLAAAGERADVVFMDPPRAGSSPEFLDALSALAPERVVYVSCNPQTQVRDLLHLEQAGYVPRIVQPVDMFPHTDHIESVVQVEHKEET